MRLFIFLIVLLYSVELAAAELKIEFRGMNHQKGEILVGLYADEEAFEQASATFSQNGGLMADRGPSLGASISVDSSNPVTATFSDLEPGRYAILAFHDLTGNGRLDRFFGIPMEPFAYYQATPPVNIPTYANTSFEVTDEGGAVTVTFGSDEAL